MKLSEKRAKKEEVRKTSKRDEKIVKKLLSKQR
jgi:hypothetical protein